MRYARVILIFGKFIGNKKVFPTNKTVVGFRVYLDNYFHNRIRSRYDAKWRRQILIQHSRILLGINDKPKWITVDCRKYFISIAQVCSLYLHSESSSWIFWREYRIRRWELYLSVHYRWDQRIPGSLSCSAKSDILIFRWAWADSSIELWTVSSHLIVASISLSFLSGRSRV